MSRTLRHTSRHVAAPRFRLNHPAMQEKTERLEPQLDLSQYAQHGVLNV
jgi:hypothetical protein